MKLLGYLSRASLLPTVLFLVIPGSLYYFNLSEWGGDVFPLLFFALAWLASILLIAVCYPWLGKWRSLLAHCLFVAGLIVLANDMFAPVQLGVLDGQALHSEQPVSFSLLELGIALAIILLFVKSGAKNASWPGQLGLILLVVGISLVSLSVVTVAISKEKLPALAQLPTSNLPNVYHIHLDAMQTDYFLRYLQSDRGQEDFQGFTLYENNISNYPYTFASVASYLTGTLYAEGRYDRWLDRASKGLPAKLKEQGYQLAFYGKKAVLDASVFDSRDYAYELVGQHADLDHPQFMDFMRLWSARVLPNAVTNDALLLGEVIGDKVRLVVSDGQPETGEIPLKVEAGIEPFSGVLMLKKLIADEQARRGEGHYVLVQPLIPHGPYAIDRDCNFRGVIEEDVGLSPAVREAYYEQVVCTGRLIEQFLDQLKKQNRYTDSMIVIHGDHGSGWAGMINPEGDFSYSPWVRVRAPGFNNWNPEQMLSRVRALLMIKMPGAEGALEISPYDTQLADIYPTILSALDLPYEQGLAGQDLATMGDQATRSRQFYVFEPGRSASKDFEIYHANTLAGDIPLSLDLPRSREGSDITCDEVIDFSDGGSSFLYKSVGLSYIGSWGRWTIADKATINFTFRELDCEPVRLTLEARGFLAENHPVMSAEVFLNGKLLGEVEFNYEDEQQPGDRAIEFSLPADTLNRNGENSLLLKIENAVSPVSLGLSKDPRRLGLGLISLSIGKTAT